MGAPAVGWLKKPSRDGFVAPEVVLSVVDAVDRSLGAEALGELLTSAELFRLPAPDEPVREEKAARLHQTLRRTHPDTARTILAAAGRATADLVLAERLPLRAQKLLHNAPWPVAAWLLGQSVKQNAWHFVGTGTFGLPGRLEIEITDNPLLRGEKTNEPGCHYHAALFERMFQVLVDQRLSCLEMTCGSAGDPSCRFALFGPDMG